MTNPLHKPHKKVEFLELFYDLVFVYAISKTTGLLHHLENGVLSRQTLFAFASILVLLVNSWMLQTVYTNRYGSTSVFHFVTTLSQMALLLVIANMGTANLADWPNLFVPYRTAVGLLTAIIMLQYLVRYLKCQRPADKHVVLPYLAILGVRIGFIALSFLLPYQIGLVVYFVGIFGSFLMPSFFSKQMRAFPIHFPHLVERLSLLVIITLGEMIIGISDHFQLHQLNWQTLAALLTVAAVFLYYFIQMEHLLDKEIPNTTGIRLIYLHYPILFGLLMATVSFGFLHQAEANLNFLNLFLFTGLSLFYTAIWALNPYNKVSFSKHIIRRQATLLVLAGLTSYFLATTPTTHILLSVTTALLAADLFSYSHKHNNS